VPSPGCVSFGDDCSEHSTHCREVGFICISPGCMWKSQRSVSRLVSAGGGGGGGAILLHTVIDAAISFGECGGDE